MQFPTVDEAREYVAAHPYKVFFAFVVMVCLAFALWFYFTKSGKRAFDSIKSNLISPVVHAVTSVVSSVTKTVGVAA